MTKGVAFQQKKCFDIPDFTFYETCGKSDELEAQLGNLGKEDDGTCKSHYDCRMELGGGQEGRALVCRCCAGERWSVTFRNSGTGGSEKYKAHLGGSPEYDLPKNKEGEYASSFAEFCEFLPRPLTDVTRSGLLVVAGGTGIGKSDVARCLINNRIAALVEKVKAPAWRGRRPHLVTFEDPIEKWVCTDCGTGPTREAEALQRAGLDYTPRQKDADAQSLAEVKNNALRQMPAILYVGEARNPKDLSLLLDYAASGHFAITTTHAGCLTEAMHGIMRAAKAQTAQDRSEVAHRLIGVLHLRQEDFDGVKVCLPALWRQTPAGINSLAQNGLSSLLPFQDENGQDEKGGPSTLGRSCLVRRLREKLRSRGRAGTLWKAKGAQGEKKFNATFDKAEERAIQMDLAGC
jgi:hypothetical protein